MFRLSVFSAVWAGMILLSAPVCAESNPVVPPQYSVRDFGAAGDGKQLDTAGLQGAIDACAKAGGGTVYVGPGTYLTGTLFLRSHVELHLAAAATILGTPDLTQYDAGVHRCGFDQAKELDKCLFYAADAENIRITGGGTIDGQGNLFPTKRKDGLFPDRPMLFRFYECRNIVFEGVNLRNAGGWCLHFYLCSGVRVHGVNIYNRANGNNDGIDLMATDNVHISDCTLLCEDDCICFQPLSHDRGVKDITITNCIMSTRWAAIRSGGAGRGGIRNVTVSNCVIYDTYGCGIKLQISGNGVMENMAFSNIVMNNVSAPISLRFGNHHFNDEKRDESVPFGTMKGISFSNIRANVVDEASLRKGIAGYYPTKPREPYDGEERQCISICGIPGHPVEGVSLSDIFVTYPGGGTLEDAARRNQPELEDQYPEYFMWGVLPAYGLYARHVKDLTLNNVRFDLAGEDLRPAVFCEDAEDAEFHLFRGAGHEKAPSLVCLRDVRSAFLRQCRLLGNTASFLSVEGKASREIVLSGNLYFGARIPVQWNDGAEKPSVIIRDWAGK